MHGKQALLLLLHWFVQSNLFLKKKKKKEKYMYETHAGVFCCLFSWPLSKSKNTGWGR